MYRLRGVGNEGPPPPPPPSSVSTTTKTTKVTYSDDSADEYYEEEEEEEEVVPRAKEIMKSGQVPILLRKYSSKSIFTCIPSRGERATTPFAPGRSIPIPSSPGDLFVLFYLTYLNVL